MKIPMFTSTIKDNKKNNLSFKFSIEIITSKVAKKENKGIIGIKPFIPLVKLVASINAVPNASLCKKNLDSVLSL